VDGVANTYVFLGQYNFLGKSHLRTLQYCGQSEGIAERTLCRQRQGFSCTPEIDTLTAYKTGTQYI
jgi:hypothetical protein